MTSSRDSDLAYDFFMGSDPRITVCRWPRLVLGIVVLVSSLGVHTQAQALADTAIYAVSYVDVMPSARATAVAALKQYRDTSRHEDGYLRLELLEQFGRPGHFSIVETWKDQKAFDA